MPLAMSSAKATAIFEADDKQLSNALLNINRKLLAFQQTIAKLAVGWEVLKKGSELVAQGFEHFTAALEKGSELANLSADVGIAVGDLQVLQLQFERAGKSAADVGPIMAKMMNGIETGSSAAMVKRLGLNMQDLRKQTPEEQFKAIGAAINALPDPAEKAAAAMDIFGKSGASVLAVFASGGFGEAAGQIGEQAQLLSRDAALFADVGDKLKLAGLKVQGFFVGVADKVAPVLKPLLDRFATLDLSELGQQVGDFVALFVQAFADGRLGEIVLDSLEISFATAANFLIGLLTAAGRLIGEVLMSQFKESLLVLQIATSPDFWKGMGDALISIALRFTATLLDGVASLIDKLSGIPLIGDKIHGGAEGVRGAAAAVREQADSFGGASGDHFMALFEDIKKRASDELNSIVASVTEGFTQGNQVIDTSGLQNKLNKAVGSIMDHAQEVTNEALQEDPTKTPGTPTGEDFMVKPAFSHLQKIGGGGYGTGGDPLLAENRQQTSQLRDLNKKMGQLIQQKAYSPGGGFMPVFT